MVGLSPVRSGETSSGKSYFDLISPCFSLGQFFALAYLLYDRPFLAKLEKAWWSHLESSWPSFPLLSLGHFWVEWHFYGGHSTAELERPLRLSHILSTWPNFPFSPFESSTDWGLISVISTSSRLLPTLQLFMGTISFGFGGHFVNFFLHHFLFQEEQRLS